MELLKNLTKRQKIGFTVGGLVVLMLIIVLVVVITNGNEPIAKIRNLDEYMVNASGEEKRVLQRGLYRFLDDLFTVDIEKLDIYIRDDTFIETEADGVYLTDFIIDIDELKSSYTVSYVFPNEAATALNPVFDCPTLTEMKYPETECVGMYNSSAAMKLEAENPIAKVLPIKVDSYDVGYRLSIKYEIFGIVYEENNKFLVRIIDYGGYNYERALEMIRSKGFDPNDYTIEYISYGSN